jgi:hypothetical protein
VRTARRSRSATTGTIVPKQCATVRKSDEPGINAQDGTLQNVRGLPCGLGQSFCGLQVLAESLALRQVTLVPRVINVDGNPSYPKVIAELKRSGELGRRCRCRPLRYLNNIVEIVFTQMTKPDALAARMGGNYVTDFDFAVGHKDAVY